MKRFLAIFLCFAIMFGSFINVCATNATFKNSISQSLWSKYSVIEPFIWTCQSTDDYYCYLKVVKELKDDSWYKLGLSMTNEDLSKERYTEILVNLMSLMEYNTYDMTNKQIEADTLKIFEEYVVDAVGIVVDGISLYTAFGTGITAPMQAVSTAMDLTWDGADFVIKTIEEYKFFNRTIKNYDNHYGFLMPIIEHSEDPLLAEAACCLLGVLQKTFFAQMNAVISQSENAAKFLGKDLFFDTLVLEEMVSDPSVLNLTSEEVGAINCFKKAYAAIGILEFSVNAGVFISDVLFGFSDTMNRYGEMLALYEIRQALLAKGSKNRSSINMNSNASSVFEHCLLLRNLLYVNYRGEYCFSELLKNDDGLIGLFKWNNKNTESEEVLNFRKDRTLLYSKLLDKIFEEKASNEVNYSHSNETTEKESTSDMGYISAVQKAIEETQCCSWGDGYGVLHDVDGNGIEELIMVYTVNTETENGYALPAKACSVYTLSNGTAVQLIDKEVLCAEAAGSSGHVAVVESNGSIYFAITFENGGTDGGPGYSIYRYGGWRLYTIDGTSLNLDATIEYDYFCEDQILYNKSTATIDGQKCSFKEYRVWENTLNEIISVEPYGNEGTMTLEELLKHLKESLSAKTSIGEAELKEKLKSCVDKEIVEFYFDDFDKDNSYEAFAIVGERKDDGAGSIKGEMWFVSESKTQNLNFEIDESRGFLGSSNCFSVLFFSDATVLVLSQNTYTYKNVTTWTVVNGVPKACSLKGRVIYHDGVTTNENGDIVFCYAFYNGWDGSLTGSGDYYFYWDSSKKDFGEYGGMKITEQQLLCVNGAKDILDDIKASNAEILSIYYRDNGIVNVNFTDNALPGSEYYSTLLYVPGEGVTEIYRLQFGYRYSFEAALIDSIATYPLSLPAEILS